MNIRPTAELVPLPTQGIVAIWEPSSRLAARTVLPSSLQGSEQLAHFLMGSSRLPSDGYTQEQRGIAQFPITSSFSSKVSITLQRASVRPTRLLSNDVSFFASNSIGRWLLLDGLLTAFYLSFGEPCLPGTSEVAPHSSIADLIRPYAEKHAAEQSHVMLVTLPGQWFLGGGQGLGKVTLKDLIEAVGSERIVQEGRMHSLSEIDEGILESQTYELADWLTKVSFVLFSFSLPASTATLAEITRLSSHFPTQASHGISLSIFSRHTKTVSTLGIARQGYYVPETGEALSPITLESLRDAIRSSAKPYVAKGISTSTVSDMSARIVLNCLDALPHEGSNADDSFKKWTASLREISEGQFGEMPLSHLLHTLSSGEQLLALLARIRIVEAAESILLFPYTLDDREDVFVTSVVKELRYGALKKNAAYIVTNSLGVAASADCIFKPHENSRLYSPLSLEKLQQSFVKPKARRKPTAKCNSLTIHPSMIDLGLLQTASAVISGARIPHAGIIGVVGDSNSGKSRFSKIFKEVVRKDCIPALFAGVEITDFGKGIEDLITKSKHTIGQYSGIAAELATLYSTLPEARVYGLRPQDFLEDAPQAANVKLGGYQFCALRKLPLREIGNYLDVVPPLREYCEWLVRFGDGSESLASTIGNTDLVFQRAVQIGAVIYRTGSRVRKAPTRETIDRRPFLHLWDHFLEGLPELEAFSLIDEVVTMFGNRILALVFTCRKDIGEYIGSYSRLRVTSTDPSRVFYELV